MPMPVNVALYEMAMRLNIFAAESPKAKALRLVREDRAACNDGRWVPVLDQAWTRLENGANWVRWNLRISQTNRYRWEYRR